MHISVFDLFSVGIGPSSSHTVGPMKAAYDFVSELDEKNLLTSVHHLKIELFGSLAFTGKGHGTDHAILMGFLGYLPDNIDPDMMPINTQQIIIQKRLHLLQKHWINFDFSTDVEFNYKDLLPYHTNGMRLTVQFSNGDSLMEVYYSIGGGFILKGVEPQVGVSISQTVPYPFNNAQELMQLCQENHLTIKELMLANEVVYRNHAEVEAGLLHIADVMRLCIDKGCKTPGILPGGLGIQRRAPDLFQKLNQKGLPKSHEYTDSMAWLNLYAIAVNEENAAGSRVVTAPTNGAAGVLPAVLQYYLDFYPTSKKTDAIDFLLVAGAIAILYKKGASISGAEVGCQGEVGTASSMAAAALTAMLDGTIAQIENAAEIAMEHHLGMTCDPIGGLVQIPCIERNAMGAVKAVNAARLALLGNGQHFVSLDKVIATMKQTGKDMLAIYKETSLGGLAANIPEC